MMLVYNVKMKGDQVVTSDFIRQLMMELLPKLTEQQINWCVDEVSKYALHSIVDKVFDTEEEKMLVSNVYKLASEESSELNRLSDLLVKKVESMDELEKDKLNEQYQVFTVQECFNIAKIIQQKNVKQPSITQ